MNWLTGISITCFAASYLLAFGFELVRIFLRAPIFRYLSAGMTLAGIFAHSAYLVSQSNVGVSESGLFVSGWSGWWLLAAWFLAWAFLWLMIRQPQSQAGVLVLPMIMLLIGLGVWQSDGGAFATDQAKSIWTAIHGFSLLIGTVSATLGFLFGSLYLWQSIRLKLKRPPLRKFRLPSLEWLQLSSERSLLVSMVFLGIGLLSGIAVNVINRRMGHGELPWNDPVIVTSGLLFGWLVCVMLFSRLYRPARQGRKVAYLVLALFVFLALEMGVVWQYGHADRETLTPVTGGSPDVQKIVNHSNAGDRR